MADDALDPVGPVRVEGLRALRKDLKAAERFDELAELGAAFGEAAEIVRAAAAARARATGRRVDQRLADSYTVAKSKTKAAIRMGDNGTPFLIGQEWGAKHDLIRPVRSGDRTQMLGWNQFPEVVRGGRFLYPAAADKAQEILEIVGNATEKILGNTSND